MGRSHLTIVVTHATLLATCVLAGCPDAKPPSEAKLRFGTLTFEKCNLKDVLGKVVDAYCTTFPRPEDPEKRGGRQLQLRVAVLPAVGREKVPDPILMLAGGPGQAATETFPTTEHAFRRMNRKRPIVLLDQRGTGGERFACKRLDNFRELDASPEATKRYLTDCIEASGRDPRKYTTTDAIGDLEALREAMGFEQLNLVGISYGTRVALTYLRRYPARVRTAILDGVVPSELVLTTTHEDALERALDVLFERCTRESSCQEAFGKKGREGIRLLLERAKDSPRTLTIAHPRTARPFEVHVDDEFLGIGIRFLMYAAETSALIPLLVHDALESDAGLERLVAQSVIVMELLQGQANGGMELSVICTEDAPFFPAPRTPDPASPRTVLQDLLLERTRRACTTWPVDPPPSDFKEPVVSDRPVLLLSGDVDPVTPPENATRVAAHLKNAKAIVAPGLGHNVLPHGCIPKLSAKFIELADVTAVDASCVRKMGPPPFFVELTGPAP